MNQSKIIKRIDEICKEFDNRVAIVGIPIARLELAKALAMAEQRGNKQLECLCTEILNGEPDAVKNPDCPIHGSLHKSCPLDGFPLSK